MKKLITLLALCCLMVTGVWADGFYLKNGEYYIGIDGNLSVVDASGKLQCTFNAQSDGTFQIAMPSRFIHIGTGGRWSQGDATKVTIYKVSGITATKTTSVAAGESYVIVGVKDNINYAFTATNYSSGVNDRRLVGTEVTISGDALTVSNDAITWTLEQDVAPETADITKVRLTFSNITSTGATVSVRDQDGNAVAGVTATVSQAVQNGTTNKNFFTGGDGKNANVLGVNYDNNQNNYWEISFTVSGLSAFNGRSIPSIDVCTPLLNSGGNFQNTSTTRTWDRTLTVGGAQYGELTGAITNSNNEVWNHFENASVTISGDQLELKVKMKRTDSNGCFAGVKCIDINMPTVQTYTVNITGVTDATVIYDGTPYSSGDTFTATNLTAAQLTPIYAEGYYAPTITIGANYVINVAYTALPFQKGKYYTMHSKASANNYVFDGTNAWYNNSVAVQNQNNLWQFEHVDGTLDLYMLKTYSGKYAVLSGSGRNALTFADSPAEWTSGTGATSYFRVVAQNGGFNLQHPGDVETNVGSHVDNKLGSWKSAESPTNNNSINVVTEVIEKTYTVNFFGVPEGGEAPQLSYGSQTVGENGNITGIGITENDLTVTQYEGYRYNVSIVDGQISVSYEEDRLVALFQYADSYANITHWYAVKMHSNQTHWLNTNGEGTLTFDGSSYQESDNYMWGFVYSKDNGVKMYNKATGQALDNSNPCRLTDNGAWLEYCASDAKPTDGFCFKVVGETQYLNYNGGIKRWGSADAGSTFMITEIFPDPVKFVSSIENIDNATWYQMHVRKNYVKYDSDGTYHDTFGLTQPDLADETSWFAFVGNRVDGFKIVNKAAGSDKAMGAGNANNDTRLNSVDFDNARTFKFKHVSTTDAGSWQIYDKDVNAAYLNQQGTNLGYWQGGGNGDDGNRFTFVEVPAIHFYTVTVIGAPNGQVPEVFYKGTPINENRFGTETDLAEGDITATDYTDYTKAITFDNSARTVTVTYTRDIKQITDLANLGNDKAYVLICERGQLTTSNGQLVGVAEGATAYTAEANKFAIIKNGDKYYLWSIAEDGYVHTTNLNNSKAAYANTGYAAQEITLTLQGDGTTFLLKLAGNGVNMQNNASGVLVDDWVQADGGNKYRIYEVEDFADADKAIAAIPGNVRVGKVYTIKAHFTGEGYTNHYLSSDAGAEQLALVDEASANQSYWVAEASGNNDRPWKFKSGFGYAKYLDWQNNGLSENGDNFKLNTYVNDGTPKSFDYNLNVNTSNRNIGTWADATKGFGAVGQGDCWSGNAGHNNSDWTTDYTIEEVTDVDVYTVTGNGTAGVTGIEGYTYAASIGNGSVVIVPAGTELTNANFTIASDVEVIINNAAKTIAVVSKIEAGTYYMTIENKETGRQPFLYNDVRYADEITLQSVQANTNGHIWKLTFDSNGNITEVKNAENGKGIKPKSNMCSSNITSFTCERAIPDYEYYYLKSSEITGGHDRLNAANNTSAYHNEAGLRAVTTWNGAHADNEWRFNAVDTEGLEEYNVVVSQPDGCRGYVLYDGKKAGNGGFFLAPAGLEQSALTAAEIRGYLCTGATLNEHTITLTYTAATPVMVNYSLYLKEGETEKLLETAAEAVTEYVGQAPHQPFSVPEYVDVTYGQGVADGLIDGEATAIKVITTYNDLMPFVPGELTTVDIDVRNHYYFHVEERTMTINDVETTLWVPCISPKEPTFEDDAAYIWRMEGDWYNGFRFHNNQIAMTDAQSGSEETTACHITFRHKEVMLDEEEQMEGMKGKTSLTEKTFKLVSDDNLSEASRATLTADASDAHSYFDLVYAATSQDAKYQFRIHGTTNRYLNFRDYDRLKDNPDSLLCLYSNGYGDQASSFTFHKGEVCTEEDKLAVQAMIDAIEKGGVGALADKNSQEYLDLQTLLARINDTTKGCTRALFETYTNKLVNSQKEKNMLAAGEAYRLAVRTKGGRNLYLKDGGGYTTDPLQAAVYVLAQKDEDTYFLAGNNNRELTYFMNQGGTAGSYDAERCDLNYEFMNGIEADGENINATPAAMYATVCLTDANGNVATMNVTDESDPTWASDVDVPFMNDDYSSAIVMEPVTYTYNKPKLSSGTGDGHAGVWATVWLPFPMVFPDGVEVYKGTQERTVQNVPYLGLERVDTDHVVPQGGYILYSETMGAGQIQVAPKDAAVAEVRTDEDAAFIGFTEGDPAELYNTYLKDHNPYVLANKSAGIGFYKYTGTTFPMGKAVWMAPEEQSANAVQFNFDDIISAIEALHGHTTDAEIYDLQGRRLDKVQKGKINVVNGQKIMFK